MITQLELKKVLEYNKHNGTFVRNKKGRKKNVGTINHNGYIKISICKKQYLAHRLAWLYEYGSMPNENIDHINHIRTDNRLCNLRIANYSENQKNMKKPNTNTSGVVGVVWNKKAKRWYSRINVDKKHIHLGTFIEFHEAVNARKNAEVLYGFHENHGLGVSK